MENQMKFRTLMLCLVLPFIFTSCDVSDWLPKMLDITKDIVTTFVQAKTDRSEDDIEDVKMETPVFVTQRDDASAEQKNFFDKIQTVQYIKTKEMNENIRTEIRSRINKNEGTNGILNLYTSANNYVIGRVDGNEVHDVLVIKDDGNKLLVFGAKGIFSKSMIESLSKSGDIFNTLNYLNK